MLILRIFLMVMSSLVRLISTQPVAMHSIFQQQHSLLQNWICADCQRQVQSRLELVEVLGCQELHSWTENGYPTKLYYEYKIYSGAEGVY